MTIPKIETQHNQIDGGPWPLAPYQDYLQYVYHVFLMKVGLKPGYYIPLPLQ